MQILQLKKFREKKKFWSEIKMRNIPFQKIFSALETMTELFDFC